MRWKRVRRWAFWTLLPSRSLTPFTAWFSHMLMSGCAWLRFMQWLDRRQSVTLKYLTERWKRQKGRVIDHNPNQDTNSKDLSFQSLGVDGFACTLQQPPESVHSHDNCSPKLTRGIVNIQNWNPRQQVNCAGLFWAFSRINSEVTGMGKTRNCTAAAVFNVYCNRSIVATLFLSVENMSTTHKGSASSCRVLLRYTTGLGSDCLLISSQFYI